MGLTVAMLFGACDPACAKPFDKSPSQYAALANRALAQVGSDLRFKLETCSTGEVVKCRFSSRDVTALVQGQLQPPRTQKIVLGADLLQDRPEADPVTAVTNIVLTLGATVVVFDPRLPAKRRVQLLSDLTNTALDRGQSEASGLDAHYSATFDEAASGIIMIMVVPAE